MAVPVFLIRRAGRASSLFILLCLSTIIARADEPVGHGDGWIHVIPSLSAPSVKNGGKLKISAVIKAEAGVAKVEAEISSRPVLPKPALAAPGCASPSDIRGTAAP